MAVIRRIAGGCLAGALGVAFLAWRGVTHWRQQTVARLESQGAVAETSCGPVEYSTVGAGEPVLVLHATPGGYDQALIVADWLARTGRRFVAPSRPGYLRTPITSGRSPEAQADAVAALLDTLNLRGASVVGVSGGGPAALQFALRHPRRLARLVLWQAVIRRTPMSPATLRMLTSGFMATDLGAWLMLSAVRIAPWLVLPAGVRADAESRGRMAALLRSFVPLDLRRDGVLNDARQNAALPGYPLQKIEAPTLIIHGSKDTTVPYEQAVEATRSMRNAHLFTVEGGTHESTFVAPKALAAIASFLSDDPAPVRHVCTTWSYRSRQSALSAFSLLSIGSAGSILSVGSIASVLCIASSGSVLSIGSVGSILSIGGRGSILNVRRSARKSLDREQDLDGQRLDARRQIGESELPQRVLGRLRR